MKLQEAFELLQDSCPTYTTKVSTLGSQFAQSILQQFAQDLPLYTANCEKDDYMTTAPNKIELYFLPSEEFLGYYVEGDDNCFEFDPPKNTKNINQIEIRKSIRMNPDNPRYGQMVLNNILQNYKQGGYDGATLQADNDKLYNEVYPKYEFEPLGDKKEHGNAMVKWFNV